MSCSETKTKKSVDPAPPPLLPPCRICHDKASGFHYGVNTCEACKGFFRRSLKRKQQYKCMGNVSCKIIGREKNNKCPKCRLDRCLEVGMSRNGIQNGRYTLEKRSQYIQEVKGITAIEEIPRITEEQATNSMDLMSEHIASGRLQQCGAVTSSSDDLEGATAGVLAGFGTMETRFVDKSPSDSMSFYDNLGYEEEYLQDVIHNMTSAYTSITDVTPEFLVNKRQREMEFLEQRELKKQVFGEMKPISINEYVAVKKATGLDIDGRKEMVDRMNAKADHFAKMLIGFAKALPGFDDLCADDKTYIIKSAARNGAFVMMQVKRYNLEDRLVHSSCGLIYDEEAMRKFYNDDFVEETFRIVGQLERLGLTAEELVMGAAVCMLLTDFFPIQEPHKVEECRNQCVACIRYLFHENHSNDPFMFLKLVSFFTEIRSLEYKVYTVEDFEETFDLELCQLFHELIKSEDPCNVHPGN